MTQVRLAAALGAAGLQDQYLRGEQRLHGIQVAAGQARAGTLGNGDGRLRRGGHAPLRLACAGLWGTVVGRLGLSSRRGGEPKSERGNEGILEEHGVGKGRVMECNSGW